MILPQLNRGEDGCTVAHQAAGDLYPVNLAIRSAALFLSKAVLGLMVLVAWTGPLRAGTLDLPNASFESPLVPPVDPFAGPDMDYWQKSPQPAWYDPSQNYDTPWEDLMGTFFNVPSPSTFIDNCDGTQAAFLFIGENQRVGDTHEIVPPISGTPLRRLGSLNCGEVH